MNICIDKSKHTEESAKLFLKRNLRISEQEAELLWKQYGKTVFKYMGKKRKNHVNTLP